MQQRGPFCARCHIEYGDPDSFTIDHIIPNNLGLKDSYYRKPNNKQLLCYTCQRVKAVLEQSFSKRIGSQKNSYLLLLDGHAEDYPNHYEIENQIQCGAQLYIPSSSNSIGFQRSNNGNNPTSRSPNNTRAPSR